MNLPNEFKVNYFSSSAEDFKTHVRALEDLLDLLGKAVHHGASHGMAQFSLRTALSKQEVEHALSQLDLGGGELHVNAADRDDGEEYHDYAMA